MALHDISRAIVVEAEIKQSCRFRTILLRVAIMGSAALLILWLLTGGVAVQNVQRFGYGQEEYVRVSLTGTVSMLELPFLFSSYTERGPFRLRGTYHNHGENSFREVRLYSAKVSWMANTPVQLIANGPLVLSGSPKRYCNSTSQGIVWHSVDIAEYTFDDPLDIPFHDGILVQCEVVAELVGDGKSRFIKLNSNLRSDTQDFIRTYWDHLAGC